jgi:hypothetical protein
MSDIETRLRDALAARANLVQPEDLTETAPPTLQRTPWFRRPGPLLAVAAAVALVIALPIGIAVLRDGSEAPDPAPDPAQGPVYFPDQDAGSADVDGDGTDDEIRFVGPAGEEDRLEVVLSSTGETVGVDVSVTGLAGAADLDGRPGAEIITVDNRFANSDTDVFGRPPTVYSLRDGALVDVLDYEYDVEPGPTTLSRWWLEGGTELRWWRTHEPYLGELREFSVDMVRFPSGERLTGVESGTWCVNLRAPEELFDCESGEPAG